MAGSQKPNVLWVSLNHKECLDDLFEPLLDKLCSHAHVQRVKKAGSVLLLLENGPAAVLLTDESITWEENAHVWKAVLEYVRGGGTAVAMGSFSNFTQYDAFEPFFAKAGLSWDVGGYCRTTYALNRNAVGDNLAAKLSQSYSQRATVLKNVSPADSWYIEEEEEEDSDSYSGDSAPKSVHPQDRSPVTFARVRNGKLGYVGDVNFETGSNTAVLVMCGII